MVRFTEWHGAERATGQSSGITHTGKHEGLVSLAVLKPKAMFPAPSIAMLPIQRWIPSVTPGAYVPSWKTTGLPFGLRIPTSECLRPRRWALYRRKQIGW